MFLLYCGLLSCDLFHNVYKVIKSGNEWHAEVERRGFGFKRDFSPLLFLTYVCIYLMTGPESSSYNLLISSNPNFNSINIFHFELYVKNSLLCCYLTCKWVTCWSECKRFRKQALHINPCSPEGFPKHIFRRGGDVVVATPSGLSNKLKVI